MRYLNYSALAIHSPPHCGTLTLIPNHTVIPNRVQARIPSSSDGHLALIPVASVNFSTICCGVNISSYTAMKAFLYLAGSRKTAAAA